MTISYQLAPIPFWVVLNNNGTPSSGAKLFTKSNLNPEQDKPVFMDPFGNEAWTNPIIFRANGTQGPFYWQTNSASPQDTYLLIAEDQNGVELWSVQDYAPSSAGGGGGGGTIYQPLVNYIANNQFIDHIPDTITPLGMTTIVAPSNHKGFTPNLVNPLIGTYGALGPDILFVKSNTAATDSISFVDFSLADFPFNPDVTPVRYLRYLCTAPGGETYKSFQFPICQKVKNLSNQPVTFTFWARVAATPATVNLYVRQYFGSGTGASAEVRPLIQAFSLTTTWTLFNAQFTVPDVSLQSLGTVNKQTDDDALYIQLDMPTSTCDIYFTKPSLYLGSVNPTTTFEDYDQINSVNLTPRTGDIKIGLTANAPYGWVPMNDGTIGNTGSGATIRASADTFQLYSTLYVSVSDTYAPVSSGRTSPGNNITAAITDFLAGKKMRLPVSLGCALAGAGSGSSQGFTATVLGQFQGTETHTLIANELPAHTHPATTGSFWQQAASGNVASGVDIAMQQITNTGNNSTTNAAFSIIQPTSYVNIFIKL